VLEQMLAGASTRRFERTREPVGAEVDAAARSTSRSAVSREFAARTRENLLALMSRRLDDVRLAVLMLDGIELKGHCCVVALGITSEGGKIPLGVWDGVQRAAIERRAGGSATIVAYRVSGAARLGLVCEPCAAGSAPAAPAPQGSSTCFQV
jgi:transposase-like protein